MNIYFFFICCAYPTPLNKTGLLVALPTMVGAFSRFSGSATIRVCWRHKGRLLNNNVAQHLPWPGWLHCFPLSEQTQVCLPLRGQTRRSCDGRWLPSSPHRPQCRTHCPAPWEGHLCNKGTVLMQENDGWSLSCASEKQAGRDWLTNVRTGGNQDISSTIDEWSNCLHVDVSSEVYTWANTNIWIFFLKDC